MDTRRATRPCWPARDADRLDLARVGIRPLHDRLCTPHAQHGPTIEGAVRMAEGLARSASSIPRACIPAMNRRKHFARFRGNMELADRTHPHGHRCPDAWQKRQLCASHCTPCQQRQPRLLIARQPSLGGRCSSSAKPAEAYVAAPCPDMWRNTVKGGEALALPALLPLAPRVGAEQDTTGLERGVQGKQNPRQQLGTRHMKEHCIGEYAVERRRRQLQCQQILFPDRSRCTCAPSPQPVRHLPGPWPGGRGRRRS